MISGHHRLAQLVEARPLAGQERLAGAAQANLHSADVFHLQMVVLDWTTYEVTEVTMTLN